MSPHATLEQQQAALVAAVLDRGLDEHCVTVLDGLLSSPWQAGLSAYRNNGRATAQRALQAIYPVLRQMLGTPSFDALARTMWHQRPPQFGDLAQWGSDLPAFIESDPQLADPPYLADVARVEWTLHRTERAENARADPQSFALLASREPATLRARLAPGTTLMASRWPVVTLIRAHQSDPPDLGTAAERLRAGAGECALVWRRGMRAQLRSLPPEHAQWLRVALGGGSLQAMLDASPLDNEAGTMTGWMADGITEGWLLGVAPLHEAEPASTQPTTR